MALKTEDESRSITRSKDGRDWRMVNVRLPLDVVRALEAKAAEQTRTVGGQVQHYLKRGIEQDETPRDQFRDAPKLVDRDVTVE